MMTVATPTAYALSQSEPDAIAVTGGSLQARAKSGAKSKYCFIHFVTNGFSAVGFDQGISYTVETIACDKREYFSLIAG